MLRCYDAQDFIDDLRSDLVRVITPERFVNGLLGIDVVPSVLQALPEWCVANVSSRLSHIADLIERMDIRESDEFWDLGCGMGGVAMLVGWLTGARAHGVEFHREYFDCATEAARAFGLPDVHFHHADARDLPYTTGTKFFLFAPFTGAVLERVLDRLRVVSDGHPITIGWQGPRVHLDAQTWLVEGESPSDTHAFSLKIYSSAAAGTPA